MHAPQALFFLGYTPTRLALLAGLLVLAIISGSLAFASSHSDNRIERLLLKLIFNKNEVFRAVFLLAFITGMTASALFILNITNTITLGKLSIILLYTGLLALQTFLVLGLIKRVRPIPKIVNKTRALLDTLASANKRFFGSEQDHAAGTAGSLSPLTGIIFIAISILSLFIYARIFNGPNEFGIDFRYGFTSVILPVFFLLVMAFTIRGWTGTFLSLTLVLIVFALPLVGLWGSAYNESNILRGLIPWSDANGYYIDANRLLEGDLFLDKSARRPLFAALLSFLLAVTDQNLQHALIILVALAAVACYLAGREVQRTHGTLAGSLMLVILFLFYRRFSGTTLTENLGVALGVLGFANIWRGAWNKDIKSVIIGILISTLALNARAGAYFTLPAIILWASLTFRKNKPLSYKIMALATAAVITGFVLNLAVYKVVASPESSPESNLSNVLYGLTHGGVVWDQVYRDHPEILLLSEPEHSQTIYRLARDAFLTQPMNSLRGALKGWGLFFSLRHGMFSFVRSAYFDPFYEAARAILYILTLVAFVHAVRRRQQPTSAFVLLSFIGVTASVPFVPLWDAAYMRLYAASIPLIAIMPVYGLSVIIEWTSQKKPFLTSIGRARDNIQPGLSAGVGLGLALITISAPIMVKMLNPDNEYQKIHCPGGSEPVYVRTSPGSYINIFHDNELPYTWVPNIQHSNFVEGNNYDFPYRETLDEIAAVSPSSTLVNTYDLNSGAEIKLIISSADLPHKNTIIAACVERDINANFFYADNVQAVTDLK